MSNWYMLTLVGEDQPGIVAKVTTALFEAGSNLGETSMIRLGDYFTIMMMVKSDAGEDRLCTVLQPVVDTLGLVLHIQAIDGNLHHRPIPDVCILVHGADRAGIVSQVTSRAAQAGLNIIDLESDVGGTETEPIYILQIEGTAAQGVESIEKALAPLQADGVKIDVSPIETLIGWRVAVLEILTYPDDRLRQVSEPVEHFDAALQARIDDLEETRLAGPGAVGIAAPQVGWFQRVLIVDVSNRKKSTNHGHLILVNPEITEWEGFDIGREGCLSVPDYTGNVVRAERIRLDALDRDGNTLGLEMEGFEARAIQHEMDHLDGLLFLDRLVSRRQDLFRRKVYK